MAIVRYIFPAMPFTWFPPHILCTASHDIVLFFWLLVTFFTIDSFLDGVDMDDLVSMVP